MATQIEIQVEQNRCAMACQGCGAAFFFSIIK
jgi:pyrroline-5-carboxylate reductase